MVASPYVLTAGLDKLELRYSWLVSAHAETIRACEELAMQLSQEDHIDLVFCTGKPPKKHAGILLRLFGQRELQASFGARALAVNGPGFLAGWARDFVEVLARDEAVTANVSAADLFCDLQGLPPLTQEFVDDNFGRSSRRKSFSYLSSGHFESALFGTSSMFHACVYDKTPVINDVQYQWLVDLWQERCPAFDSSLPVARCEFRFRKAEALARLDFPRRPVEFLQALPETWNRLCRDTLWFLDAKPGRRKDRKHAAWWDTAVANATFDDRGSSAAASSAVPGVDAKLQFSMALGALANLVSAKTGLKKAVAKERLGRPLLELVKQQINAGKAGK